MAYDGLPLLFNTRKGKDVTGRPRSQPASTGTALPTDTAYSALAEQLGMLGVQVDRAEVGRALQTCFPAGTAEMEPGYVLKMLLRHLRGSGGC